MKRENIIQKLNESNFDKHEYWVITGSAMVLYGIRESTHDIDLGCTKRLADQLQTQGYPITLMEDGTRKINVGDDMEIFEDWLVGDIQTVAGIPVISLPGLIEMKRSLGREKDMRDIQLIEEFLRR